ncbi:hypothetical protein KSP39_PZI022578 [Platanthera zijinensis]|uniref:Uncharacterized protein n=1 Tax=Platanthera zijinensis TaxID=2320716 RepID=A0AAP0AVR1_9ASPA
MMFSQVVATGSLAWAPNSRNFVSESMDEHDLSAGADSQDVDQLPSHTKAGKKIPDKGKRKQTYKRSRSSTMEQIAETSRIIGRCMMEPPRIQISSSSHTIAEAITELESMEEVMEENNYALYDFCTVFLKDKGNRETFMSIRKDRRLRWLETRRAEK